MKQRITATIEAYICWRSRCSTYVDAKLHEDGEVRHVEIKSPLTGKEVAAQIITGKCVYIIIPINKNWKIMVRLNPDKDVTWWWARK